MARPWHRSLVLALVVLFAGCSEQRPSSRSRSGPQSPAAPKESPLERQRQVELERRRSEHARCLRDRPALQAQMASLRRSELALAQVKGETYTPLPPPAPWDEAIESRYRLEDREADLQRHLHDQQEWHRREQGRQARWIAEHRERVRQAQWALDRQTQELRAQRPDLFTGPGSIEFNPEVARQIRQCEGKTPS